MRRRNSVMHFKGNFLNYLLDQFADIEALTFRKMFGGIGFFKDNYLFAVLSGGKLRLRAVGDPSNCAHSEEDIDLQSYGEDQALYCAVPNEILNDKPKLLHWAEIAYTSSKRA
jgi:DNA transformation protein